jgi:hypothetical protein
MAKCIIGAQAEQLPPDYRKKYEGLINLKSEDGGLSNAKLAVELKRVGFRASQGGLAQHRRNECNCAIEGLFE